MTQAGDGDETDRLRPPGDGPIDRARSAIDYCMVPARRRRTVGIAIVVGILLTRFNQGDVILGGNASGATAVKAGLNFLVPFLVSNLRLLSGRDNRGRWRRPEEQPWARYEGHTALGWHDRPHG